MKPMNNLGPEESRLEKLSNLAKKGVKKAALVGIVVTLIGAGLVSSPDIAYAAKKDQNPGKHYGMYRGKQPGNHYGLFKYLPPAPPY